MTPEASTNLVDLTEALADDLDVMEVLAVLVDRCVALFHVSSAGLMLAGSAGDLVVVASSSPAMRILELLEQQADEGPCPDCFRSGEPIVNASLATSLQRWPSFAPRAIESGYGLVHAVPIRLRDRIIGALNLFGVANQVFEESDVRAAQAFADVAAVAVVQHRALTGAQRLNQQLNHALTSRIAIEQAKGLVSARTGVDMDRAFARMRAHARSHNVRLADIAEKIIAGSLAVDQLRP